MALVDLTLNISACVTNNCNAIKVTDITGLYEAINNPGGWEDASTLLSSDVTGVTITITTPSGTVVGPTDVFSQFPSPITMDEFDYSNIALPVSEDGEYIIEYKVDADEATGASTKTKRLKIYSTCKVRCCIDKLWSKWAKGLDDDSDECGCTGSEGSSTLDKAKLGEALLSALNSTTVCNNTVTRDKILAKLNRLCKLENCNCN